ncbi:neurogenic locus notch homolog protein 1-like [Lytechinus variegatus]|uniref:neurogenic locus notch homolog protein 1-like n=1 Tax=Lytechinus variegatus TaxID=7654 RepID=UPI001BB1557C|nr:neurogenic locus notch homolog protein 1-like [Lytechinus variegatus]
MPFAGFFCLGDPPKSGILLNVPPISDDPCVNIENLCFNGATCVSAVTGYSATFSCNCAADRTGPRCNEDKCTDTTCSNGGTCESDESTGVFKQCLCPPLYDGVYCQFAYPCASNPCQGNGTCTDHLHITPYNFSCICQSPFIGQTCQYEDPCYTNPCLNGGTCSYTGGVSFQPVQECVCSSGFYGELCENAYPCTSNPCRENGICTNKIQILPYDYECNCTHPYIGRSCQYENPCYENPCQNGATCTYSTDGVTSPPLPECLCPPTHYGELCEKAYPCTSNPCQGRGSCSNNQGEASANNFTCDCSSPYIGLTCQYVNPCSTNPCENNGSCSYVEGISTSPVRTCTCLSVYYGNLCENAYPCASNPCHGKGNCTNNLQSTPYNFICNCNSPHIGLTCQYDDPCHNATCLNGGTCEYTGGSTIPPVKSCLCQDGFIGDVCESAPTTMTSPDQNTIQSGGTTTTPPVLTKEAPATPTDSHPTTQNTGNTATLERTEVTGLETLEPSLSYSPSSAEPTDHPRDRATPTPTGSFDLLTTVIIINAILVVIIIIGTSVAIGRYCLKKRHKRDNQGKDEPLSGPEAEAAELFAIQRKHGQLMFQRVDSGYVNTVVLEPVSTSYNTGHPTTKSGRQLPPLPLEVELIENEEIYKKHQSEGGYEHVDDGGDSQQGQESDYDSLEPENKIDVDVDSDVVHGGYEPVYEPGLPKDHAYEETIEQSARKHRHEDSIKYENCTAETNHGLTDIKPQAPKGTQNNEFHMVLTVETEC